MNIIIVGQSGAGRSTALHVFEDMRASTADGVPARMLPEILKVLADGSRHRDTAIGLAQYGSRFPEELAESLNTLKTNGKNIQIIFLKADMQELIRRYATTRRPHPFERQGIGLEQAIKEEWQMLAPVIRMADTVIDTTRYSIHDLRRDIQKRLNTGTMELHPMKVNLVSFGFKYGIPTEADLMFDMRFLPNPFFDLNLRGLTGRDYRISRYIFASAETQAFKEKFITFIKEMLPLYEKEGRYRLTIAIGCTGGRHRSVSVTEALASALKTEHYHVLVEHRHMNLE